METNTKVLNMVLKRDSRVSEKNKNIKKIKKQGGNKPNKSDSEEIINENNSKDTRNQFEIRKQSKNKNENAKPKNNIKANKKTNKEEHIKRGKVYGYYFSSDVCF